MKINPIVFDRLKLALEPYATPEKAADYLARGLSWERFAWDCFHAAHGTTLLAVPGREDSGDINWRNDGVTDAHILTALKKIVPPLPCSEHAAEDELENPTGEALDEGVEQAEGITDDVELAHVRQRLEVVQREATYWRLQYQRLSAQLQALSDKLLGDVPEGSGKL